MPLDPNQVEQIFGEAVSKPTADARVAFLAGACGNDTELRERVEALLVAHDHAAGALDLMIGGAGGETEPVGFALPPISLSLSERPGSHIGRYKLLEQIGEGGFGVVFMAEQEQPIRRRVALKIIKLGMDTRQVVARFEAERQALAVMDHPSVAKVFDGGATETGRPYFVMELVKGIEITKYCDEQRLSTVDRLKLFIPVCEAVQHAHQKGIIHRDLKPSNVLVTLYDDKAVPKVIDFGVAKATQARLTEKTLFTEFRQLIGTPAYMSPEQAQMSALDVDTRSDIYSLGVLLYELLSGTTPFDPKDLMNAAYDEMRRVICEVDPPRPSTRLSTLAADTLTATAQRRHTDPKKLSQQLRGDLDWIVMRCLEKDRTRRYESASALAADMRHFLADEPVAARAPGTAYRLRKWIRRNRLKFAASVALLLSIVCGIVGTSIGMIRARSMQHQAQQNFDQARAAVSDLLYVSDERLQDEPGMQPLRLELMKAALERYEPFLSRPTFDPAPRAELARLHARYGFLLLYSDRTAGETVLRAFESAKTIQEQLVHEHPADRATRSDLGWTFILEAWATGRPFQLTGSTDLSAAGAKAIAIFEKLAAENPGDPFARCDLAVAMWRQSFTQRDASGFILSQRAVDLLEQLVHAHPDSVEFRRNLANTLETHWWFRFDTRPRPAPELQLPVVDRVLAMRESIVADLEGDRAGARLPTRARESEGRLIWPSRVHVRGDLARSLVWGGQINANKRDYVQARSLLDHAIGVYQELVERNPADERFIEELAEAYAFRLSAARAGREPPTSAPAVVVKTQNGTMGITGGDQGAAYSCLRRAAEFWDRVSQAHPDQSKLREQAERARKTAATQPVTE